MQLDLKGLELLYAKRIARQQQLLELLLTQTGPPLYWRPAQHCKETQAQVDKRAQGFDDWKVSGCCFHF